MLQVHILKYERRGSRAFLGSSHSGARPRHYFGLSTRNAVITAPSCPTLPLDCSLFLVTKLQQALLKHEATAPHSMAALRRAHPAKLAVEEIRSDSPVGTIEVPSPARRPTWDSHASFAVRKKSRRYSRPLLQSWRLNLNERSDIFDYMVQRRESPTCQDRRQASFL